MSVHKTFDTPGPLLLGVRLPAGSIRVETGETAQTEVVLEAADEAAEALLEAVRIEFRDSRDGHELLVTAPERRGLFGRSPRFELRVRCPLGVRVDVRTRSADFEADGRLGSLELRTTSGDVEARTVDGAVLVQSTSGDVALDEVGGAIEVKTTSGDVTLGRVAGSLRAWLVSGDLSVADALGTVETNSVSGDQRLRSVNAGSVSLQSVSGDIEVAVRRGAGVWMDVRSLSGETQSELLPSDGPPAEDAPLVELRVKTVSGDIRIERAGTTVEPV